MANQAIDILFGSFIGSCCSFIDEVTVSCPLVASNEDFVLFLLLLMSPEAIAREGRIFWLNLNLEFDPLLITEHFIKPSWHLHSLLESLGLNVWLCLMVS